MGSGGYVVSPMEFFNAIISTQEGSVGGHIVRSLLDSVEAPFSEYLQKSMRNLLSVDSLQYVLNQIHSQSDTKDDDRKRKIKLLMGESAEPRGVSVNGGIVDA